MTDADVTPGNAARVANLSRPRCIELLKQERWGRVAFQDWDGPQLLPVSYVYWTGNVVFSHVGPRDTGRTAAAVQCRVRDRRNRRRRWNGMECPGPRLVARNDQHLRARPGLDQSPAGTACRRPSSARHSDRAADDHRPGTDLLISKCRLRPSHDH